MKAPVPYYRSESCRVLAEKVARNESHQTLDININIDDLLRKSKAVIGEQVVDAIHANNPFALYQDTDNYYLVEPGKKLMVCVVNGVERAQTVSPNDRVFANNVKLAIAAYDKFMLLPKQIEPPSEVLLITCNTVDAQHIVELK